MSIKEETTAAAMKSAVPVGVSGGLIFGFHINELVQIATLIFLIAQIGLLIPRYWAMFRSKGDKK